MHPGVLRASSGLNLARGPLAVLSQANLFVCFSSMFCGVNLPAHLGIQVLRGVCHVASLRPEAFPCFQTLVSFKSKCVLCTYPHL